MLERVPATAEPAVSLFLRNFEKPRRSTRVLDPTFWRNRADGIPHASWWPLYLQKVRQIPQSGRTSDKTRLSSWTHSKVPVAKDATGERSYSISASDFQRPAENRIYDVFGLTEEIRPEAEDSPADDLIKDGNGDNEAEDGRRGTFIPMDQILNQKNPEKTVANSKAAAKARNITAKSSHPRKPYTPLEHPDSYALPFEKRVRRLVDKEIEEVAPSSTTVWKLGAPQQKMIEFQVLLQMRSTPSVEDFDRAWQLFISLENQEEEASSLLHFLARSNNPKHFSKAREAFRLIPRPLRDQRLYKAIVDIELKRFQHKDAMNLAFEASVMGFDILPGLFAHFVRNMLWNSATELIYRNRTARKDMEMFVPPSARLPGYQMLTMTELLSQCGTVKDLPIQVLSLSQRLQEYDAALFEHFDVLAALHRDLILVCVRSSKAMNSITASALIALFDLQKEVGNLKLHAQALSTIQKLSNRKDKAELALLTYRNFRHAFPKDPVQRWMLGSLIAICGEAKYSLHIYDYLLGQFEEHFGQPDALAYQRVMTLCARQGSANAVQRILEQYLQHASQPKNLEFLSPLIYACAVNGDKVNAKKQFDRIKEQFGFEQNVVCWNMLMLAHARSEDDVSAFDILERMQQNNVRPNSYSYGILLAVCDAHADKETALRLLADAEEHQIHISVPMINTLIEIYLSDDDIVAASRLALATTKSGTKESLTRTWNIFLRYAAIKGDFKQLMRTRAIMTTHNIKADDMSYAALVLALTTMRRTSEAMQVLRKMHYERGISITPFHYSIILHGFLFEGNRDMATVIYNEMLRRFPRLSMRPTQAMQLLHASRDRSDRDGKVNYIEYLAKDFSDLFASNGHVSQFDDVSGYSQKPTSVASLYFETTLQSLIRNKSYDDARQLLEDLEANMGSYVSSSNQNFLGSSEFLLAKMELAVAHSDGHTAEEVWDCLFKNALEHRRSINTIKDKGDISINDESGTDIDLRQRSSNSSGGISQLSKSNSSDLGAWRISLSRPLNRYMEAMARQGRQAEVLQFLRNKFEPAGFQLTGTNWNKYVQILCRSPRADHHISAFKVAERRLIGRAQSWKLLARGLLRQKNVSYVFEKVAEHLKRPILQKKISYAVRKRSEVMRLNPRRSIPTYTTMVHLGSILSTAQRRASHDFPGELESIGRVAKRTKLFIQRMPWLKDSVQGELLRNRDLHEQPQSRPRSEDSFREKVDVGGILDSKSYIDQVPIEHISNIGALVKQSNEMRDRLKGSENFSVRQHNDYDKRAINVAEKLTGQIARTPEFLASQGRLETEFEMAKRIHSQERQKLQILQNIRKELKDQSLTRVFYERDLESPVGSPNDTNVGDPSNTASMPAAKGELQTQLPEISLGEDVTQHGDQFQPVGNSSFPDKHSYSSTPSKARVNSAESLNQLSVQEQLRFLKTRRDDLSSRMLHRNTSKNRLALPYAELRRVEQQRAMKQRNDAQSKITELYELGLVSSHALEPRTAAGRRFRRTQMAQDRLSSYMKYQNDLRHGKRLPPFPKTKSGYRRHRRKHGPVNVRFVADLNRNKFKYLIRKGFTVEKRQPNITDKVDQSKFLVPPKTGGKSHRTILRQRLLMRRVHLRESAIRRVGFQIYERYMEKKRKAKLAFQPFR